MTPSSFVCAGFQLLALKKAKEQNLPCFLRIWHMMAFLANNYDCCENAREIPGRSEHGDGCSLNLLTVSFKMLAHQIKFSS